MPGLAGIYLTRSIRFAYYLDRECKLCGALNTTGELLRRLYRTWTV